MPAPPRVAIVHDWLNQIGGAEDVLSVLHQMYASAPIHTSIYDRTHMPDDMRSWDIRVSWMDRLPGIHRRHQPYLPLYPLAFGGMRIEDCDVVLSNKSGFCIGVDTGDTRHVCYCLTPTRYVWNFATYADGEGLSPLARTALAPLIGTFQRWEFAAARRVHTFIAISTVVRDRIRKHYGRDSIVIFPPVDTARFAAAAGAADAGDYYLCLGRLIGYKRVDLAIEACNALGRKLLIAGSGRDRARLESLAGPTVKFLGRVPDADVPSLLAGCRAFLFPGLEDFGIAPVQALAAGRPVIAYAGGGALDTVEDGRTGLLFHEQTSDSLAAAIERFERHSFERNALVTAARRFDTAAFRSRIAAAVAGS